MDNDNKKQSTLDQIRNLGDTDNIDQVEFQEPELKQFSTANIFEVEKTPAPKKKFGKRSERRASQVRIKQYDEEMPDFTDKEPIAQSQQSLTAEKKGPIVEEINEEDVEIRPVAEEDLSVSETARLDASDLSRAIERQDTIIARPVKTESVVYEQDSIPHTQQLNLSKEETAAHAGSVPAAIQEEYDEDITFNLEPKTSDNDLYLNVDEDVDDIYEDKKRFSLTNYPKIEEYLADQSAQGYHFVRQDGKTYYFVQGKPYNYIYSYCYFRDEPDEEQLEKWKRMGWNEVSRMPGKRKKDAGWIIFRNLQNKNQNVQRINNDEEKLRYFKKQASSYRSTLFLIFICIVCCAITAWLQVRLYNGYWAIIGACGIIALICLIMFFVYLRYLRKARKRAKILKAKIKDRKKRLQSASGESDSQLNSDWDELEAKKAQPKKKKKKK